MAFTSSQPSDPPVMGQFTQSYCWSANSIQGKVCFAFIDHLGNLRTATIKDTAAQRGNLNSAWKYNTVDLATMIPYKNYEDVNLGIYPSERIYLCYNVTNVMTKTTRYRISPDFTESWEAEVTSAVITSSGPPAEQPAQITTSSTLGVVSENRGLNTHYFRRGEFGNRLYCIPARVWDNGTWYLAGSSDDLGGWTYFAGTSVAPVGPVFGNIGNNLTSDYFQRFFNSNSSGNYSPEFRYGMTELEITTAQLTQAARVSPICRLRNGCFMKVVWGIAGRKIRKIKFPGGVYPSLKNNYTTPVLPILQNFTLPIPTSATDATNVRIYWDRRKDSETIFEGVLDSSSLPTKVTWNLSPAVDWSDSTKSGGCYIALQFTYKNANNLKVRVGTSPSGTAGEIQNPLNGRGQYPYAEGINDKGITLYSVDLTALQAASGTFSLPLSISQGSADEIVIQSVRLIAYGFAAQEDWQVGAAGTTTWTSPANKCNVASYNASSEAGGRLERAEHRTSILSTDTALINDINANKGTDYAMTLRLSRNGATPSDFLVNYQLLDAYAVFEYQQTQHDFWIMRSQDGKNWEYANDFGSIANTDLDNLRAWNRDPSNSGSGTNNHQHVPSLVPVDDGAMLVWLESGAVKCLMSEDYGDTWHS